MAESFVWPDFFPPDCPPEDAEPASGIFYRLISGDTPHEADFKSHRELYPERTFSVPDWQTVGLSVYADFDDILKLRKRIPALRKRHIAKGILTPGMGKILPTPGTNEKSHHTWWVPVGQRPWEVFERVELSEE